MRHRAAPAAVPTIVALSLSAALACTLAPLLSEAESGQRDSPPAAPGTAPTNQQAEATVAIAAGPTTTPDRPHRIAIRVVEGVGEFYDRETGARFTPRGANYLHFATQEMEWGETSYQDSTFATDYYNPEETAAALEAMHSYGFNVVRVFLLDSLTGIVGRGPDLYGPYVDNVADFLAKAADNDIYVLFTIDWLPGGSYGAVMNRDCCDTFALNNAQWFTPGSIEARGTLFADLHKELVRRGVPVEYVFSYELRNEIYYDRDQPPLSFTSGLVTTANGATYDMASPGDKQRMMDEMLVYHIDAARATILEVDPTALVSAGFFVPQGPNAARVGDRRLIETAPAIWQSSADFIDLHLYPGFELNLVQHVQNFGVEEMQAKPVVMGEFGAFKSNYGSAAQGAQALQRWQIESCQYGFDGWLMWHWDTAEDQYLWNALDEGAAIARALSPLEHPDPCA